MKALILFIFVFIFGAAGCGGEESVAMTDPQLPPAWTALGSMASDSGAWQVAIWTWPQPAVKGQDDVVFQITDAGGVATDGLTLQVVPWMPSHGHGTTPATVIPEGGGYYLVKPVYLYMSGDWQLLTTIGSTTSDSVTPVVEIP